MPKEFPVRDTRYTEDVAFCPWCYAPQRYIDDGGDEGYTDGEEECCNCGRNFKVDVEVTITRVFTTEQIEEELTDEERAAKEEREARKPIEGQIDIWGKEVSNG